MVSQPRPRDDVGLATGSSHLDTNAGGQSVGQQMRQPRDRLVLGSVTWVISSGIWRSWGRGVLAVWGTGSDS